MQRTWSQRCVCFPQSSRMTGMQNLSVTLDAAAQMSKHKNNREKNMVMDLKAEM